MWQIKLFVLFKYFTKIIRVNFYSKKLLYTYSKKIIDSNNFFRINVRINLKQIFIYYLYKEWQKQTLLFEEICGRFWTILRCWFHFQAKYILFHLNLWHLHYEKFHNILEAMINAYYFLRLHYKSINPSTITVILLT